MALNAFDANYLRMLVEEAQEETRHKLSAMPSMVERTTGPFWDGSSDSESYVPENVYFEYLTTMIPRLVFSNPRVRVRSRRVGPQEDVADAVRHALNRMVQDQHLSITLRDLAEDMLFNFGVAIVKEKPKEGVILPESHPLSSNKPTWPFVERIPQNKFIMDGDAYDWASTRFRGHEWRMDKTDLLERAKENPDEGWDQEEIEALATDIKEEQEYQHGKARSGVAGSKAPRKYVRAYDVWIPEIELDDSPGKRKGFHGTIFTIAIAQANTSGQAFIGQDGEDDPETRAGFIRAPRPFYGPETGPYTLFGAYRVPDTPFPLSPLVACEGQIQELNEQIQATNRARQKHKKLIAVPDDSTAQKVKNTTDHYVVQVPFEQGKAQVHEMELGGPADREFEWSFHDAQRVQRLLGMDETMTGNKVGGATTATETTLANESALARISELKESFTRAVVDLLTSMAFYAYYSDTVIMPLGEEVFEEADLEIPDYPGVEVQPWYQGGDPDPEGGHTFYDLELEIEPYSMERTSEGLTQQRMLATHEMIMNTLPLIERYPDFPWKEHFKKVGESMNMPNLETLITKEMLERLTKQMEMMMQMPVDAQMAAPQGARFSKNIGGPVSQASGGGGPATGARVVGGGMQGQKSGSMSSSGAGQRNGQKVAG